MLDLEAINGRFPNRVQSQPLPSPAPAPSPAAGGPVAPARPAPPAGMRYNAFGKLVPVRNVAPPPGGPAAPPAPMPGPAVGPGVPAWLQQAHPGATPQQLQQLYQGYLGRNPNAPGNAGRPPAPGGQTGGVTPMPPAPASPNGGWGMPPGAPPPSPGGSGPGFQPGDFNDPFNMFLSAVPGMNLNMQKQIGDAMATAGFSGNRYSSSAENAAGQIGAQNALDQNALLQKTLYDYANQRENRGLQADQLGLQTGQALDEMQRNRLQVPWGMGQYEQGRQDQFSNTAFQDWSQNRLGWLPMLLNAANAQGAGSPGQIYQTTQPGSPGLSPWISLLGGLFGGGG